MISTAERDRETQASGALAIRGLTCRRGTRTLFSDLDLDVAPGELAWLRAANGYGKTTLLRVVAGLAKPEAGAVRRAGLRAVLYLAHANALKDDLTVGESVRYMVDLHGLAATDAAIADAIARFGLHSRRNAPIRTLSQGQRRRVALTRLCLSEPQATWLLDEPYDALDSDGVALVDALMTEHAARGGNALFTSHVTPALDASLLTTVHLDAAVTAR